MYVMLRSWEYVSFTESFTYKQKQISIVKVGLQFESDTRIDPLYTLWKNNENM